MSLSKFEDDQIYYPFTCIDLCPGALMGGGHRGGKIFKPAITFIDFYRKTVVIKSETNQVYYTFPSIDVFSGVIGWGFMGAGGPKLSNNYNFLIINFYRKLLATNLKVIIFTLHFHS